MTEISKSLSTLASCNRLHIVSIQHIDWTICSRSSWKTSSFILRLILLVRRFPTVFQNKVICITIILKYQITIEPTYFHDSMNISAIISQNESDSHILNNETEPNSLHFNNFGKTDSTLQLNKHVRKKKNWPQLRKTVLLSAWGDNGLDANVMLLPSKVNE